ncbi:CaMKMT [Symbiodinium natans]|uniref:Calmodulin-lysine N-methyltransferase n=1 Tax=Symbiodinium natans TaxID=878477 RepID=A0A812PFX4_9DINO|nr:CaMKMT [Symbiodinium natans]
MPKPPCPPGKDERHLAQNQGERSHWGLFDRIAKTVRDVDEHGQVVAYKSLAYNCGGKAVEFRQPLEGSGTKLMHGDFARKISPSEEALATFILKRPRVFHARRVLVVGAGLGFAGLVAGACTSAREVLLTDGDPEVVRVLETSLQLNHGAFDESRVAVQQVLWDRMEQWPPRHSFDLVIGADVVYLEDLHWALLEMLLRVLRPGGQFLLFASRRNGSLEKFLATSKSVFSTVEVSTDYDPDVDQAIGRSSKCFPVFAKLSVPAEEAEDTQAVLELRRQFAERHAAELRKAERAERRRVKAKAAHRARSQSLLARRERRLQAQEEEAALPLAPPEPSEPSAPRKPLRPTAEIEGRSDWGLFERECVNHADFKEFTYNCEGHKVRLHRTPSSPRISASAESLACWVLRHPRCFRRRRVLEVGAGQGLPGLLVAASAEAKHVEFSDGDPLALEALADAVKLNESSFVADSTSVSRLSFGDVLAGRKFDWIIASDILETKAVRA